MDAAIDLITGILRGDPLASNLKLNLPHVVFSTVILTLAWRGGTNAPKVRVATPEHRPECDNSICGA